MRSSFRLLSDALTVGRPTKNGPRSDECGAISSSLQTASCKYTAASCYANITGAIDESRSLRASRRREIERRVLVFSFQAASARFQLSVRYCLCVSKTRILVAGGPGRRRVTTRFPGEAEPGVPAPNVLRRAAGPRRIRSDRPPKPGPFLYGSSE